MSKSELQLIFDEIFERVGYDDKFQTRYNILFNFVFLIFIGMPTTNLYIAMSVPRHWCYVPGRELTNFTQEEWKNLTIPRANYFADMEFSSCKMFKDNVSFQDSVKSEDLRKETVDCQYGWEYDNTWYTSTIPSQENWVCDRELVIANTFAFTRLGDILGSFVFGQLGDTLGRTFVYYSTVLIVIISRILLVFSSSHTELFLFIVFVGGFASTSVFQSPLVIGMEITSEEKHATMTMMQCIGWTIAFCSLPMIMWCLTKWIPFVLLTSIPCAIFLFAHKYLVESPRWLASKGKKERCLKELKKIARVNQRIVTDDLAVLVDEACSKREEAYGIITIFSHWRLAKNTFLLIYGTLIANTMYLMIMLGTNDMHGNPYMNYFWQGLAELPAYIIGRIMCNKIGRRLTNVLGCCGITLGSFILIFTINDAESYILSQISVVLIKFCIALAFYAVNLTAIEIYPTPVRQSGFAIGGITANFFGMTAPYILHLKTYHASYPYVVGTAISFFGILFAFLLPETFNERVPNTLAEAYAFGKDQPYFYIPKKSSHTVITNPDG